VSKRLLCSTDLSLPKNFASASSTRLFHCVDQFDTKLEHTKGPMHETEPRLVVRRTRNDWVVFVDNQKAFHIRILSMNGFRESHAVTDVVNGSLRDHQANGTSIRDLHRGFNAVRCFNSMFWTSARSLQGGAELGIAGDDHDSPFLVADCHATPSSPQPILPKTQ
jgi:hypothetical protein